MSERLGRSTVKLTLDACSHVSPAMQEQATEKLERMLYGVVTEDAEEKLQTG